jgi:hypothetical protein
MQNFEVSDGSRFPFCGSLWIQQALLARVTGYPSPQQSWIE